MFWVSLQVVAIVFLAAVTSLSAEQVTQLRSWHRAGQTFLTWNEVHKSCDAG